MKTLYDAIVVGARAAGAATAMLLARRGARTTPYQNGASTVRCGSSAKSPARPNWVRSAPACCARRWHIRAHESGERPREHDSGPGHDSHLPSGRLCEKSS